MKRSLLASAAILAVSTAHAAVFIAPRPIYIPRPIPVRVTPRPAPLPAPKPIPKPAPQRAVPEPTHSTPSPIFFPWFFGSHGSSSEKCDPRKDPKCKK